MLDAGDVVFGSAGGDSFENIKLVAEMMNNLTYDTMSLGNHELDYGSEKLYQFSQLLDFSILASNMRRVSDHQEQGEGAANINISSYASIPLKNQRHHTTLCVIGITVNEENPFVKDFNVDPEVDVVLKMVQKLKSDSAQECARIVILSHGGINVDRNIAKELSLKNMNVDAILGGHSHVLIPDHSAEDMQNERVKYIEYQLILHAGLNGRHVSLLCMQWDVFSNAKVMLKARSYLLMRPMEFTLILS